uniref:PDZ domain-containing protein n=2 Tax=Ciona intestinalis TaxID=7719 RepID=F6YR85_CIOIN
MTSIASVKKKLLNGWEVRLGLNGRVYYYSGHSHTIQILPPPEAWDCEYNLPYGYEMAVDYSDRVYFLNHIAQRVSYNDPRVGQDNEDQDLTEEVPLPRHYVIKRDEQLGFGFIAGSEKPVIVRSVSPGGPSENKLQPGDQIIKIGSEHVKESARERVIDLIKYSTDEVDLTVL